MGDKRSRADDEDRCDFFISYTQADRPWAEWIAWQLETEGFHVVVQAWDFRPGTNFVHAMRTALDRCGRTLAVLSSAYLQSVYATDEWTAAFTHDEMGEAGLLLLRIEELTPPRFLRPWVYVDLVDLDPATARIALLAGIEQDRAKPTTEPPFPGRAARPAPRFPGAQHRLWSVPYPRNAAFTGRHELLAELHARLSDGHRAALTQAVTGLGGVGKTQLALEYAYRYRAFYQMVWWLDAEDPATVTAGYTALATALDLPEHAEPDLQVVVAAVLGSLEANEDWLLVFDNAEDPAIVRRFLPSGGGGKVLVTSRNPAWRGDAAVLAVPVLARPEAVDLLCARSGLTDRAGAKAVAAALGDLPLALAQAGAYLEATGESFAGYLELMGREAPMLLGEGRPAGYDHTVVTTWAISVRRFEDTEPAAVGLLRLLAYLGPDDVPRELVQRDAELLPEPLGTAAASRLGLNKTVGVLRRYSLVEATGDGGLTVHRLVQAITRDGLDATDQRTWATAALQVVSQGFPQENVHYPTIWKDAQRLLPHALAVTEHAERLGVEPITACLLLDRLGVYQHARGQLQAAQATLLRALTLARSTVGDDDPTLAVILGNLGRARQRLGDYAGAKENFEQALVVFEAAYGPDDQLVATALSNLGDAFYRLGEPAAARDRLERALAIREAALGDDHPRVAATLVNLGNTLRDLNELEEARRHMERALAIYEATSGPESSDVALTLTNLGPILSRLGDPEGARQLLERALAIDQANLGPEHPDVAADLHTLGAVLYDLGDLDGARAHLERALAIFEATLGPEHPEVAMTRENLDIVLRSGRP